jgi:hypothetical protein
MLKNSDLSFSHNSAQHLNNTTTPLSDVLLFLIRCCQNDPRQKEVSSLITFIDTPTFNIQEILTLANAHGVMPLVYKMVKNISKDDYPDASTYSALLHPHYLMILAFRCLKNVLFIVFSEFS